MTALDPGRARRDGDAYWRARHTPAHQSFRRARDLLLENRTDHDTACRLFRWPRFRHFNWALEWFDVIAAGNDAPALVLLDGRGGETAVGFAELAARSDAFASRLAALGVARGDRVLVALEQRRELWETLLACLKLGAVVIPAYTGMTAAETADRMGRARIRHVVCEARLARLFGRAPSPAHVRIAVGGAPPGWTGPSAGDEGAFTPDGPTPAGDVALAYFTSGTTARPRAIAHTHVSYPVGHLSSMYWNGLLPGDRHLNLSAPGWAKHSWSSLFAPWNAEAAVVVPPPGGIAPGLIPGVLRRHAVTAFCAPPSAWQALLPHLSAARPALREALSAGERLDPEIAELVERAWGVRLRDGYGQTETTGLIGTTPGMPRRPGWLGKPLPGYRIGLRDPGTGAVARTAPGTGEICVDLAARPAGMMRGRLDEDSPGRDGWYGTGDLGERDPDGWIRVLGRRDEVFKSSGHRVSPPELEAVLRRHPAVAAAAIVPRPDPAGGQVPHAVVEPVGGRIPTAALARDILAHAAAQVAAELRPRTLEFTGRLPRTPSGKIRRSAAGTPPAGAPEQAEQTEQAEQAEQGEAMTDIAASLRRLPRLLDGRAGGPLTEREPRFTPLTGGGRRGVEAHHLYSAEQTGSGGPAAALVRYLPGAVTPAHRHTGWELVYVLEGELETDAVHGPDTLLVMEPGSVHGPRSRTGCLLLTIWERPVEPA